jgi:hypothetical protein
MISESELPRFLKTGRRQLPLLATDDASRRKAQRFGSHPKEIDTAHNRTGFRIFSAGENVPDTLVESIRCNVPQRMPVTGAAT